MAKGSGRNTETKAALRRDGGFIYLCLLFRPVGFCFSKILRLCRNPPSQNPPVLLPRKSVCCHTLPHRRVRRQPLSRVSRKQRYNTLDFAEQNRVPTGMLAPLLETQRQRDVPFAIPHFPRRCIYKLQKAACNDCSENANGSLCGCMTQTLSLIHISEPTRP